MRPLLTLTSITLALSLLACDALEHPTSVVPRAPATPSLHQGWYFPSQDTHDDTLSLQAAALPLQVVRGTARFDYVPGFWICPQSLELSDLVVGIAEEGSEARLIPLHFEVSTRGSYQGLVDARMTGKVFFRGLPLTVERGIQGTEQVQTLRYAVGNCGTLEITTEYVSPTGPVDQGAWEDYAYSRTLLATEKPLYTDPVLGLTFLSLIPTAAPPMEPEQSRSLQAIRSTPLPYPESGCRGAGLLPNGHFRHLETCAATGYLGCYLQLLQVDMNGRHYRADSFSTRRFFPEMWQDLPEELFDLTRYLRGVSLSFQVAGVVDMPLLPRALRMVSSGSPELEQELIRRVHDPRLDEFNRVSALFGLRDSKDEDLEEQLRRGDLSPLSRTLLDERAP